MGGVSIRTGGCGGHVTAAIFTKGLITLFSNLVDINFPICILNVMVHKESTFSVDHIVQG